MAKNSRNAARNTFLKSLAKGGSDREQVRNIISTIEAAKDATLFDYILSLHDPFGHTDALIPATGMFPGEFASATIRDNHFLTFGNTALSGISGTASGAPSGNMVANVYGTGAGKRDMLVWVPGQIPANSVVLDTFAAQSQEPTASAGAKCRNRLSFGPSSSASLGWDAFPQDSDMSTLTDSYASSIRLVSAGLRITLGTGSEVGGFVRIYQHDQFLIDDSIDTDSEVLAAMLQDHRLVRTIPVKDIGAEGIELRYKPVNDPNASSAGKGDRVDYTVALANSLAVPPTQMFVIMFHGDGANDIPVVVDEVRNYEYSVNVLHSNFIRTQGKPTISGPNSIKLLTNSDENHEAVTVSDGSEDNKGPRMLSLLSTPATIASKVHQVARIVDGSAGKSLRTYTGIGKDVTGAIAEALKFGDESLDTLQEWFNSLF